MGYKEGVFEQVFSSINFATTKENSKHSHTEECLLLVQQICRTGNTWFIAWTPLDRTTSEQQVNSHNPLWSYESEWPSHGPSKIIRVHSALCLWFSYFEHTSNFLLNIILLIQSLIRHKAYLLPHPCSAKVMHLHVFIYVTEWERVKKYNHEKYFSSKNQKQMTYAQTNTLCSCIVYMIASLGFSVLSPLLITNYYHLITNNSNKSIRSWEFQRDTGSVR